MLSISKITLRLRFTTPAKLPYWMGSAFRGGFGQNLRRACCVDMHKDCDTCEGKDDCLFYYTHMRSKAKRGYAPPIKPIILIPPFFGKEMNFEGEGYLDLGLIFFGDFRRYLPHAFLGLSLLGQTGIGSSRYYGGNKFEIIGADCNFSGRQLYDGETINLMNLRTVDIIDVDPSEDRNLKIGFRTPFTGKDFPPDPTKLLTLIRNRVIRFVNEYGTQEEISDFNLIGEIKNHSTHYHNLQRRSTRSDKTKFDGYTGVVEYDIDEIDNIGKWLLNLGFIIGCGPDSSFGCGFLQKL